MRALQPIIFLLVCIAFWSIVAKVKNYAGAEYRAKLISTMIVILFIVHPDIADIMFSSFNCVKVDDKYRMTQNIRSICYQGEHIFYISLVAFPSIGVWVLGIPLLAFIILRRNKRVIELMGKKEITKAQNEEIFQLKTKYGFLFSGYDARAYFWEIIIMYRKILIIASSVFFSSVSSECQVLVVIFIIVCNMFFHIHINPYQTPTLNKMESYSILVAAVTIYTGMFYVTGKPYTYMKIDGVSWFFLICIVLPNFVFIVYWAFSMRIEVLKAVYKICKEKNLNIMIFKILAFTSAEKFYDNYIRKDEEFEQENKQIIIDEEAEIIKVDDVVLEVTAFNQDETASNILIEGCTKEEKNQQKQDQDKKKRHKGKRRYEEDWAELKGGMASSRSYKVYPDDIQREIPRDEFDKIKEHRKNEGPHDGLQFTLNDEAFDYKNNKKLKQDQNQVTKELNKSQQFIKNQDKPKENELIVNDNESFSLGEIEIEQDEIQSSPKLTPHDNHSGRKHLIHNLASKSSLKSPSKQSPRNQSQPRNEKQYKSSSRLYQDSQDPHFHQIEVSPQDRMQSKQRKDNKDIRKKKAQKEDRHSRNSHGGEKKRKRSHSQRTKKDDRKK